MESSGHKLDPPPAAAGPPVRSKEAAARAFAEAEERHKQAKGRSSQKETGGRGGLDPARYGDWEVKGIASDF